MKNKKSRRLIQEPLFHLVRQEFDSFGISDVATATRNELQKLQIPVPKGRPIAIAVGSRGIDQLSAIVREVVRWVIERGGKPFIVPSMGSHGGATPEGQQWILEKYGVSEAMMGCPIRSSLDVVKIPAPDIPAAVFMDRYAHDSAGVILINRVKPHTEFHGPHESGLVKMLSIGLGKHAQALAIHRHGAYGLRELMPRIAKRLLDTGKILCGIGIVENAYDKTHTIRAIPRDAIVNEDKKLLKLAYKLMPSLPFDSADVLIVDEMGKNISGTGMDPNIIGQRYRRVEGGKRGPDIGMLICRDLSTETKGNACGMGFADLIPRSFFQKINFKSTYENTRTASAITLGKTPMVACDDLEAWEWALRGASITDPQKMRAARIRNTLDLAEIWVSTAMLKGVLKHENLTLIKRNLSLFGKGRKMTSFKQR